ncbi:TPA: hypothetical protein ACGU4U_004198 [Vibrio vulnificus]|uniref:hypothetical protein n=1 Tax=Shewanella xiamenensis TaxID=332186 RepID=UPI000849A12B|nr:hypothetical protein [Shewanella xiamenensis]EIO4107113.1 hypothetical protein [Vibrio vulnificus]EJL6392806.1 hypothetical protein [Vibrio vulnificus]ODR85655.1 hypothetical protein ABT47_10225 [Shewanella xiamenensis]
MPNEQAVAPQSLPQDGFRWTQTFDVQQPQATQAMVIPKSEWSALKANIRNIKDSNSLTHTIGSALIGAGISIGAAALFTPFTAEQEVDKVIMWAIAISCTFCGVVSCIFANREKALVTTSAANVLSQMEIVESRYQNEA